MIVDLQITERFACYDAVIKRYRLYPVILIKPLEHDRAFVGP